MYPMHNLSQIKAKGRRICQCCIIYENLDCFTLFGGCSTRYQSNIFDLKFLELIFLLHIASLENGYKSEKKDLTSYQMYK